MGKVIFQPFDIALPAFLITDGVLVALIGYRMLVNGNAGAVRAQVGQACASPGSQTPMLSTDRPSLLRQTLG